MIDLGSSLRQQAAVLYLSSVGVATQVYSASIAQLKLSDLANRNVHGPYPQQISTILS
jgi:hypothetical protein